MKAVLLSRSLPLSQENGMVEFCTVCGTSLPKGDLTIRDGKFFTSPDYMCPSCGQLANPSGEEEAESEISTEQDIVFRQGNREVQ